MSRFHETFYPSIGDELDPLLGENEADKRQTRKCIKWAIFIVVSFLILMGLLVITYGRHYPDVIPPPVNLTASIENDSTFNGMIPGHDWSNATNKV